MTMTPVATKFYSIMIFLVLCSLPHAPVRGEYQPNVEEISAKRTVCSGSKVLGENSAKIVPAYGPCSPTREELPDAATMLARDWRRRAYIRRRVTGLHATAGGHGGGATQLGQSASQIRVPARDALTVGSGDYLVPVHVGTPWRLQYAIVDTGSDLCWIQCRPCTSCHSQAWLVFDPAKSFTSYVQCDDAACKSAQIPSRFGNGECYRGKCTYEVEHMDGSRTSGFLARDRVSLTATARLGNFTFGCGNDNRGLFKGTAGLIGLGRSRNSLNSQLSHLGNIFSYCLPPTYSDTGHLTLGDGGYPRAIYTPIVSEPDHPYFVYVGLLAMSVDGRLLPVPKGVFVGAKTIIDSAALISYIPPLAYAALRAAIRGSMTMYKLVPSLAPGMDTCYGLGNLTTVDSPTVTLHFTNADLRLGFTQTFLRVRDGIYCLAYSANETPPTTIGTVQQRGMEVIYDLGADKIGFSTVITNCK